MGRLCLQVCSGIRERSWPRMAAEFVSGDLFPGTGGISMGEARPVATLPQPPAPTVPGGSEAFDSSARRPFPFYGKAGRWFGGPRDLWRSRVIAPPSIPFQAGRARNWRRRRESAHAGTSSGLGAAESAFHGFLLSGGGPASVFVSTFSSGASPRGPGPRTPGPNSRA